MTAARYAYVLEQPASDLVHALKYEGWRELAAFMGGALTRLVPMSDRADRRIVVPVPTTPGRLRRRGFNQAELLARSVAGALGLPLVPALERPAEGASQTSLAPDARRRNVRGAFRVAGAGEAVRGAEVLLVDDVLTTGATASEAAAALAAQGAERVTLLAYGRALPGVPRRAA